MQSSFHYRRKDFSILIILQTYTDVEVAFVFKNLEHVFIGSLYSYVDCCLFVVIADVWICSLVQQELYYINMTPANALFS